MARFSMSRMPLAAWGVAVVVWLTAPILIVAIMSFTDNESFRFPPSTWSLRWYRNFFEDPSWYQSLVNSVQIALVVMVVATLLGTAAALGLNRMRSRVGPVLQTVLLLPTVVPVLIAGIGMYSLFLRWRLTGTPMGFILAHTVLSMPFVFISVTASLQTFDRRLEQAAAICGASPLATFFQVTLRIIAPGVLTGAVLSFLGSFNETIVSIFLVSPTLRTLPVQMYTSVAKESDPTIAAASTLTTALTAVLFLVALTVRAGRSKTDEA
ncbi:ABC transporter permease [Streptomyces sp. DSM 3412]|uniref:ABC transporter permease n=1 Tax=Streptomyces gottesmaniae TaxID=3075518 RepID=A0ABU2Z113_9ACTN|nr:ABC transporter permease [Streptomyces sp. DSM 3412]MDT0570260.1 ABC transporter permease [Streptomyces sp. DSM 3412]